MNEPVYLTTIEAAKRLHLSKSTLDNWRSQNMGPAFARIGSNVVYLPADLDAWVLSRRTVPGAPAAA